MKKTQKKIFGLLGIALVAAMTIIAAALPNPGATAVSVHDTITIRVVGNAPDVNLTGIESGAIYTHPKHTINFTADDVDITTVTIKHIDRDNVEHVHVLGSYAFDYEPGSDVFDLDLNDPEYGYGEYTIIAIGEGFGGVNDTDIITFTYLPVYGTVVEDEDDGKTILELDYNPYDEDDDESDGEVAEIEINIYDENGNKIDDISPIFVTPPTTEVELPVDDLPSGTYKIEIIAYDKDGEELYKAYWTKTINEEIPVPDTGAFLRNLNISRVDYLLTGLLIFFSIGIFGFVFIAKKQRNTTRRRRK